MPTNEKLGNCLKDYPKRVTKVQKHEKLCGEWELTFCMDKKHYHLNVKLKADGHIQILTKTNIISEADLTGFFVQSSQMAYQLMIKGTRSQLFVNKDYTKISYATSKETASNDVDASPKHPSDKYVIKFEKIELNAPKNVQKMAIVQVWRVSE